MKELFALTILRVINLGFASRRGMNPDMISLENKKGQTIYIEKGEGNIMISGYKVSKRCFLETIDEPRYIEEMVTRLKGKLYTDDNEG